MRQPKGELLYPGLSLGTKQPEWCSYWELKGRSEAEVSLPETGLGDGEKAECLVVHLTVSDRDLCLLLPNAGLQEVEDDRPRGGYACGWGIKVSRKELRMGARLD